jgi:thymidylate synthase
MRSNDLIWGLSAVNVFNFTFMQEYFSAILGVPLGAYYHCVNNLHYYDRHQKKVEALAKYDPALVENPSFEYQKSFTSLAQFDQNLQGLSKLEHTSRKPNALLNPDNIELILEQRGAFFKDWAKVLFSKSTKQLLKCDNPILEELMKYKLSA